MDKVSYFCKSALFTTSTQNCLLKVGRHIYIALLSKNIFLFKEIQPVDHSRSLSKKFSKLSDFVFSGQPFHNHRTQEVKNDAAGLKPSMRHFNFPEMYFSIMPAELLKCNGSSSLKFWLNLKTRVSDSDFWRLDRSKQHFDFPYLNNPTDPLETQVRTPMPKIMPLQICQV